MALKLQLRDNRRRMEIGLDLRRKGKERKDYLSQSGKTEGSMDGVKGNIHRLR